MANQPARSKVSGNVVWTSTQAYTMAVLCLLIGVGAGWFLRGSENSSAPAGTAQSSNAGSIGGTTAFDQQQPSPEAMKRMADKQAEPLLAELKTRPNDPQLLTELGNIYFDAKQFKNAIDYYSRVLKMQPSNNNVRTDMGIAYWYGNSDADRAISEFNKVLSNEPTKPETLQSIGIVKWQGKSDPKGAIAAWEKLLQSNPGYEKRADIQQLINQAKGQ